MKHNITIIDIFTFDVGVKVSNPNFRRWKIHKKEIFCLEYKYPNKNWGSPVANRPFLWYHNHRENPPNCHSPLHIAVTFEPIMLFKCPNSFVKYSVIGQKVQTLQRFKDFKGRS